MNSKCCFYIKILTLGLLYFSKPMLGGRLQLRPISSEEAIRILKEYARNDAKTEGRFITSGIAAVKGFALGITKGMGIPLAYDFVTSNSTIDFLIRLSNATKGGQPTVQYETEEVCIDGDYDDDYYYDCGNDCDYNCGNNCDYGNDYGNDYDNDSGNDYDGNDDDYDNNNSKRRGRNVDINLPKDTIDTLKMKEILSFNVTSNANKVEDNRKNSSTKADTTGVTQSKRKKRSKTCIVIQKPKVPNNR
uniref:Uncharacterized protein n=1 Tax=Glossina brevipalpis TaxID=37001 RepID=A0A1A9WMR2_9MUSC